MVKAVVWMAVFAACVGAGALLASHTDPFPPGVADPGARFTTPSPSSVSSPPSTPAVKTWRGAASARTFHDLFVGGRCATDWHLAMRLTIDETGSVAGSGSARLQGALRCDTPTAQVQSETVALSVAGHRRGSLIDLAITGGEQSPVGSDDFGGLLATLTRFPPVRVAEGTGSATASVRSPDGDLGTYGAVYRVRIDCAGC